MMRDKVGLLDSYHLGEALKGSAGKLGERCGKAAIELLSRRFTECIGTPDDDKYSYIWRAAIEDHEQDEHKDSFQTVLVDVLRDAALGIAHESSQESRESIRSLLLSPYPTLGRIGIYVCSEHYGNVGIVFWESLRTEWFVDIPFWHELFWFIKKTFPRFSAMERKRFLDLVMEMRGDWKDKSQQEAWDETDRRDLLHPAVGLGDSEVDLMYENLVVRLGAVREHPDFHTYSTSGWIGERSPVASDELIQMSDEELLTKMRDFAPDSSAWDGPTYRGFASTLSAAVRASEDGFSDRIQLFLNVARPYQHGLLEGLKARWTEDKLDINWTETLTLIQSLVQADSFRDDLNVETDVAREPSIHWVISDIADLIKAGSANNERSVAPEILTKSIEILQSLLSVTRPTHASEAKDAVSHAINSPRGRALDALINVALAMRRHEVAGQQDSSPMWTIVGPILDHELSMSEAGQNADFAALAGMYCNNLHYLNAGWVEDNFHRIFSTTNESAWNCAAQGFAYQRYLYEWLYTKLTEGGHLRRMVFRDDISDSVADKALQFLGLAYLKELEELDDGGLMSELIATLKSKELSYLCWFFWTLRESHESSATRVPKILEFWRRLAIGIRASEKPHGDLQSALNLLAEFIGEMTPDLKEMWAEAAPYAQISHHGDILIKYLARMVGTHPQEVAAVFRAALSGFLPDYPPEDVIRCVKQLAAAGQIDDAEWICNEYVAKGSMLLKDTYEELRASQRLLLVTRDSKE